MKIVLISSAIGFLAGWIARYGWSNFKSDAQKKVDGLKDAGKNLVK